MRSSKAKILFLSLFFLGVTLLPAVAQEESAASFGVLSLLPPLLAILLAFLTKRVLLSLFIGIYSGSLMINGWNPVVAFMRTVDTQFVNTLADGWHAGILIFTITIGGMVGIVQKMGGTRAIAEALAKRAKTARGAQLSAAILGIVVFFDDYANTLIVGPTMRPLMDKMRVSREKLSYIVDSTAAPVVGLAFVSTWVGYEIGLFGDALSSIGSDVSGFALFIRTIPYTFYNIFALVMIFSIIGTKRDFGPMLKAEKRARSTGEVLSPTAEPMSWADMDEEAGGPNPKTINAILPILTLVLVSFFGLWYNGYGYSDEGTVWYTWEGIRTSFGNADASVVLIWGAFSSTLVALLLAVGQKILTLAETMESFIEGSKSLLITAMILILAWSLGSITEEVGTASFLVGAVSETLPGFLLPIIVFVISCVVAFATGTSWGTMAIVIPLAVPLAAAYVSGDAASAPLVIASLSAVLSGSIFGDHCSPISDTTIMSSMASGADHMDHVKTQIPYAVSVAGVAIVSYLLVAAGLPVLLVLVIGGVGVWAIARFAGKESE